MGAAHVGCPPEENCSCLQAAIPAGGAARGRFRSPAPGRIGCRSARTFGRRVPDQLRPVRGLAGDMPRPQTGGDELGARTTEASKIQVAQEAAAERATPRPRAASARARSGKTRTRARWLSRSPGCTNYFKSCGYEHDTGRSDSALRAVRTDLRRRGPLRSWARNHLRRLGLELVSRAG